ncbi:hypothetical protein X797_008905 [Metarhizium robertsii]|uniref:Uncharacterized protein n=1 Tax=Metarhizium robertsii TaxID=568076 RepID=A0A014PMC1_9HYPO|nr:hypothetical protein X797_008905 [Metarhizium robertsii]
MQAEAVTKGFVPKLYPSPPTPWWDEGPLRAGDRVQEVNRPIMGWDKAKWGEGQSWEDARICRATPMFRRQCEPMHPSIRMTYLVNAEPKTSERGRLDKAPPEARATPDEPVLHVETAFEDSAGQTKAEAEFDTRQLNALVPSTAPKAALLRVNSTARLHQGARPRPPSCHIRHVDMAEPP